MTPSFLCRLSRRSAFRSGDPRHGIGCRRRASRTGSPRWRSHDRHLDGSSVLIGDKVFLWTANVWRGAVPDCPPKSQTFRTWRDCGAPNPTPTDHYSMKPSGNRAPVPLRKGCLQGTASSLAHDAEASRRSGSLTGRLSSVTDQPVGPTSPCRNGRTRSAGGGHALSYRR